MVADVPVSAPQTQVAQLEATIRSAHALLQAGLVGEASNLLAAFSPEVQPNIDLLLLVDDLLMNHLLRNLTYREEG